MAVERMEMIDLVGHMDDVDEIAKKIILSSSVHMVSAITEVQQNNFPILKAQENMDAVLDYNYIRQYTCRKSLKDIQDRIDGLVEIFELKKKVILNHLKGEYNFQADARKIYELYKIIEEKHGKLKSLNNEIIELLSLERHLTHLRHIGTDLNELMSLKYIKMKLGRVTKYNMDKLKKNYENISGIVFRLYEENDDVIILLFVPVSVEIEVDRVLVSLDFEEYKFKARFEGTPSEWFGMINMRKKQIAGEIESIKNELQGLKQEHSREIEICYSRLMMEYKIEELKGYIACTNDFFYLTGWIPISKKKELLKSISKYEERLVVIWRDAKDARQGIGPPTNLKNMYFIKPFESIVRLYGVPSYNETDPTAFVGLSYMILFGAMFGDVGQGFVLFMIGEILSRRNHRPNLGGVIARLGISSIIFGFLYGSFFGFENVFRAIIVKPMSSINVMLLGAVVFGAILLSISFIYNLVNSYKNRDVEGGIFSRNGLVGLVFYWLLLYFIIVKVSGYKAIVPESAILFFLIVMLALMLFREPISNLVRGKRPLYSESKTDYYIEGGFGVVETLLSMFSNTVSFIRVGAFAINHVGLFIAFQNLAEMMSNEFESVFMIILGNIVIIGLEGLIVFIQGLRLEYYELFSKYYNGVGYEYNPCLIRVHNAKPKKRVGTKGLYGNKLFMQEI